ncbi:MAG: efflux RND transporter periplasmic adaptor subunit [Hyphomicrobiaceae bacterium]
MTDKTRQIHGQVRQDAVAGDLGSLKSAGAQTAAEASKVGAVQLLAVESKVRTAKDEVELLHLIANESRKLVSARQVIILRRSRRGPFEVACVSSVALVEGDTPFTRWISGIANQIIEKNDDTDTSIVFDLPAFADPDAAETTSYPFPHMVWHPLRLVSGDLFAGIFFAREQPWSEQEVKIIARECDVFSDRWQALYGNKALKWRRPVSRATRIIIWLAAIAISAFPVPLTALAPVEIIAKSPQRVTAPIDGIIKEIMIEPNAPVRAGDIILRFDETTAHNRLQVTEQELLLANARLVRTRQAAFSDEKARHDLGAAQAEYDLKKAERDYAAELLAKSQIVAHRSGVLVYENKDRWIGKPVSTGERIMEIVDPNFVMARIDLAVADAIVLSKGVGARLFLDANPLSSLQATLASEAYQAEPNATQQLVVRILAEIDPGEATPRIGSRGTAQIKGATVPLAYYLLRRPLSAFRQHFGI